MRRCLSTPRFSREAHSSSSEARGRLAGSCSGRWRHWAKSLRLSEGNHGERGCPKGEAACGDLGRWSDLSATVRALRPDVVVNAAAYTAVDKAETEC